MNNNNPLRLECHTIPCDRLIFIHCKKGSSVEKNFFLFKKYPYSSKYKDYKYYK